MTIDELYNTIKESTPAEAYLNEPLKKHTTIRIGGPADILVIPKSIEDLRKVHLLAISQNIPLFVMGNGSNLLVSDEGIRGLVLKIIGMNKIEVRGESVIAQAGTFLPHLLKVLEDHNLAGLEFAAGVPASLGGAVVMNLGAFGSQIGNLLSAVKVMNRKGELKTLFPGDLKFDYRRSSLQGSELIVLEVILKLSKVGPGMVAKGIKNYLKERSTAQPLAEPSAGSIFRNPERDYAGRPCLPAGRLIEQAGGKGLRVGDAQVSEKHANFIVNLGTAKASDVLELMDKIQELVKEKFGIRLEPEVKIIA